MSDIAPLVYQLLLLATKVSPSCCFAAVIPTNVLQGHKVLVLTGVISFFNNKHQEPLTMSQQEGCVKLFVLGHVIVVDVALMYATSCLKVAM